MGNLLVQYTLVSTLLLWLFKTAPKPDISIFHGFTGHSEQNILSGDGGDVKIDPK
jgi:hypothetical protein